MRLALHHSLAGGGTIRQLRPSDRHRFHEHLLRLDTESRRDRFNGAIGDGFLDAYAERCFRDGTTVVGYVYGEHVRGAAEIHERPEIEEPTAEIAFSVEREFQHRGLGGLLFERLIGHAYGLGYERLLVTTHPNNQAMKALARRFDARLSFEAGETVGVIDLAPLPMHSVPPFGPHGVHPQAGPDEGWPGGRA